MSRLLKPSEAPVVIPRSGLAIMWTTIGVKLVVWIFCRKFKSDSVRALAQDAENDILFNFFSLIFPVRSRAGVSTKTDAAAVARDHPQ
jgi:hypothetical protein